MKPFFKAQNLHEKFIKKGGGGGGGPSKIRNSSESIKGKRFVDGFLP